MNSSESIVARFPSFSHYIRSSEFKKNPKANVFTPLRKVTSTPTKNNDLPLTPELKFEIIKYLRLKDFAAFSSINVKNYLSLRSDDFLIEKVVKKEIQSRLLDVLKDLKQRAQQYTFVINAEIETDQYHNAVVPDIAISPGPSQLILTFNIEEYSPRSFDFVKLFQELCIIAKDDSINELSRAHICSLAIDINNKMISKVGESATLFSFCFLGIATQVNQLDNVEEKDNKLYTLASMIENEEVDMKKLNKAFFLKEALALSNKEEFDWDMFLNGLRSEESLLKNTDDSNVPEALS